MNSFCSQKINSTSCQFIHLLEVINMPKSIILFLLIFSMINFKLIFAQDSYSLQFNGGIISPRSSSNGPMGVMQFNYSLNSDIMFYIYSGYSTWNQNKVRTL